MYNHIYNYLNKSGSKYCYLLLDPLGYVSEINPLHIDSIKERVKLNHVSIIARPELAYNLNSCPHLICIKEPNGEVDTELLKASIGVVQREHLFTKNYVCGWIVSDIPPDELANKCLIFGASYAKLFNMPFLAFYEPFRMQLLQDCNSFFPRFIESIIDWCDSYSYVDVSKELRIVTPTKNIDPLDRIISEEGKYYQHQAKNLLSLFRTWNNIRQRIDKTATPESKEQLIKMCEYSYQAASIGITNMKDNDIYVLLSMQHGSLLRNNKIKQMILESKDEPGELAQKLRNVQWE